MRFALAMAALLVSTASATAAYAQTPANPPKVRLPTDYDKRIMKSIEGSWITNSGSQIDIFTRDTGDAMAAAIVKPADDGYGEGFLIQPYDSHKFWGGFAKVAPATGRETDPGYIRVEAINESALTGARMTATASTGFSACRASARPGGDAHVSGRFWVGIDGHRKQPDGSYKVTATLLNIEGQKITIPADNPMTLDGQGKALASATARQANGEVFHQWPELAPCQATQVSYIFDKVPSGAQRLTFHGSWGTPPSWDVAADFARTPPGSGTGPSTPPAPPPPPPPPPPPRAPSSDPAPQQPSGSGASSGWQRYGDIWSFKLDELGRGPDGSWQAVVSVRSESRDKVGLTASEIDAYLTNADGETLPEAGNLYKASVTGTAAGLEKLSGTQWMQQGDTMRVRLLFLDSARFNPIRFRLKSSGGDSTSRNFPVG